jgi:hypothetical protein
MPKYLGRNTPGIGEFHNRYSLQRPRPIVNLLASSSITALWWDSCTSDVRWSPEPRMEKPCDLRIILFLSSFYYLPMVFHQSRRNPGYLNIVIMFSLITLLPSLSRSLRPHLSMLCYASGIFLERTANLDSFTPESITIISTVLFSVVRQVWLKLIRQRTSYTGIVQGKGTRTTTAQQLLTGSVVTMANKLKLPLIRRKAPCAEPVQTFCRLPIETTHLAIFEIFKHGRSHDHWDRWVWPTNL